MSHNNNTFKELFCWNLMKFKNYVQGFGGFLVGAAGFVSYVSLDQSIEGLNQVFSSDIPLVPKICMGTFYGLEGILGLASTYFIAEGTAMVKKGFPVPPLIITTRSWFRYSVTRLPLVSSTMGSIARPPTSFVFTPIASNAPCNARLLITVASIPI